MNHCIIIESDKTPNYPSRPTKDELQRTYGRKPTNDSLLSRLLESECIIRGPDLVDPSLLFFKSRSKINGIYFMDVGVVVQGLYSVFDTFRCLDFSGTSLLFTGPLQTPVYQLLVFLKKLRDTPF